MSQYFAEIYDGCLFNQIRKLFAVNMYANSVSLVSMNLHNSYFDKWRMICDVVHIYIYVRTKLKNSSLFNSAQKLNTVI